MNVVSEQAGEYGMERSYPEPPRTSVMQQLINPLAHFIGGFVGEGQRKDLVRRHLLLANKVGYSIGNNPGFTRPRSRENHNRAFCSLNGLPLYVI